MSLKIRFAVFTFLFCLMHFGVFAEILPHARPQGRLRRSIDNEDQTFRADDWEGPYDNGRFLDTLLARPNKRQWCRKGMIYNHVLGSCTLSLSALRGRSKWT